MAAIRNSDGRPMLLVFTICLVSLGFVLQGCGQHVVPGGATSAPQEQVAAFECESTLRISNVAAPLHKGIDLDDTTLRNCSWRIPVTWPHTGTSITSLRLFKPWDVTWPTEERELAWGQLVKFVQSNGAKVLLGTRVSCLEKDDDADWALNLQLLKLLGPEHVMGLAVGNEMEMLQYKPEATAECMYDLWDGGRFWRRTLERVADMERLGRGFEDVPITSVFGAFSLAGGPFLDMPKARINSYLTNATQHFGNRWAFTFNVYPYYNPANHLDANTTDRCEGAIRDAACYGRRCNVPKTTAAARQKMMDMGVGDYKMWLGETGWSWPQADTLDFANHEMAKCPEFSSEHVFRESYEGFLGWNLSIGELKPPDHMFWFTMRDADNFNVQEHFGLVRDCAASQCKMQEGDPLAFEVLVM